MRLLKIYADNILLGFCSNKCHRRFEKLNKMQKANL